MNGICPITLKEDFIRRSHIFPKFMWKHLKNTGGCVFRNSTKPTIELQNGLIMHLLGEKAEQMFSKRELWFEKNIFTPYVKNQFNNKLSYGVELYYFAISLLWRVLYINRDNVHLDLKSIVKDVLEDWRSFLNKEVEVPLLFQNIYIMPLDSNIMGVPHNNYDIDFYLLREFDVNIMTALFSKDIAIYCKFPRFCIWGQLSRDDTNINYGIKISSKGGILKFKKFNIGNGIVRDYIINRIYDSAENAEKVSNELSDKVQDTIVKRIKMNIENVRDSELGRLLLERGSQLNLTDNNNIVN